MTISTQTGFARVTIVAPSTRVDVSLPPGATIAELLPQLLRLAGEDLASPDAEQSGWGLARVGEQPIDASRTVETLALQDGETLYLAPRRAQPPPPVFDDVAEAIAHTTRTRPQTWRPVMARPLGFVAGALLFAVGAALVAARPSPLAGVAALALAIVLVPVAAGLARALGDAVAGAVLACVGMAYAFAGGIALVSHQSGLIGGSGARLVVACVALTVLAVLGLAAVGDFAPMFVGVSTTAGLSALTTLLTLLSGGSNAGGAAVTAAVLMAVTPLLPALSLRLAGLSLPPVPADSSDFNRDDESLPGPGATEQSDQADRYLTALLVAFSALLLGCQWLLVLGGSTMAWALSGAIAGSLLLRSRAYTGRVQRVASIISGLLGGSALAVGAALTAGSTMWFFAAALALVVAGGVAFTMGLLSPEKRKSPYWGRLADIVEVLLLVSIVPLALDVFGLYQLVRGLGG